MKKKLLSLTAIVLSLVMVLCVGFTVCSENSEKTDEEKAEDANVNSGLGNVEVGSIVTFGTYEQDNDTSNGKEEIEWRVLAVENGKALLISEKVLDSKVYNEERINITWEMCTLRSWLNDEFYNTAFNSSQKSSIDTISVINDDNPDCGTEGENNTSNKVFLLSIDEANKYFSSDEDRKAYPTLYEEEQGDYVDVDESQWWLRSPGYVSKIAAYVSTNGIVNGSGGIVYSTYHGIRPAIWVSLSFF